MPECHIRWRDRKNSKFSFPRNCMWNSVWLWQIMISIKTVDGLVFANIPTECVHIARHFVIGMTETRKNFNVPAFHAPLHRQHFLSLCFCLWANAIEIHSLPIMMKRKTISVEIYAWHWSILCAPKSKLAFELIGKYFLFYFSVFFFFFECAILTVFEDNRNCEWRQCECVCATAQYWQYRYWMCVVADAYNWCICCTNFKLHALSDTMSSSRWPSGIATAMMIGHILDVNCWKAKNRNLNLLTDKLVIWTIQLQETNKIIEKIWIENSDSSTSAQHLTHTQFQMANGTSHIWYRQIYVFDRERKNSSRCRTIFLLPFFLFTKCWWLPTFQLAIAFHQQAPMT